MQPLCKFNVILCIELLKKKKHIILRKLELGNIHTWSTVERERARVRTRPALNTATKANVQTDFNTLSNKMGFYVCVCMCDKLTAHTHTHAAVEPHNSLYHTLVASISALSDWRNVKSIAHPHSRSISSLPLSLSLSYMNLIQKVH